METTMTSVDEITLFGNRSFEESITPFFSGIKRTPHTPLIDLNDPRLDVYHQLGLDVEAIHRWLNHSDSLFRRNRHQILQSFPILLPALAIPDYSSTLHFDEIACFIDRANPLIENISRVTGIGRPTIRYLMTLSPLDVGLVWIKQPIQLFLAARILPESLQPKSAADWTTLHQYWALSGLGNNPEYGFIAGGQRSHLQEHMFYQLCRNGYSKRAKQRLEQLTDGQLDRIYQTRDYFDFVTSWCSDNWEDAYWTDSLGRTLGESFLMCYSLTELVLQSMQWHLEINQQVESRESSSRLRSDSNLGTWPPLLQETVEDFSLQAISLVCASDLVHEGSTLKHCVGQYVSACLCGHSHIVSIRDMSGRSLSTAELTLHQGRHNRWEASVQQHYGYGNSPPSVECSRLLDIVLLKIRLAETQPWLNKLQAIHDERRDEIEFHMYEARCESREFNEGILRRVIPDFDRAISWLVRQVAERKDA